MSSALRFAIGWVLVAAVTAFCLQTESGPRIGVVVDEKGPVAKASVGWQGQSERVTTDAQGSFRIAASAKSKRIVASKSGYRIASAVGLDRPLTLRLERLPKADNSDYEWIDPHADPAKPNNCANCHGEIYCEWKDSAHARSATNPKFLHLFAGTDGKSPVQKKWNARAEHPDGAAVCATCHAPTLKSATLDYDIRAAKDVVKSGIHCDYCHKVADVPMGKFGTRFGRDALHLLRPAKGELLSFGPLDDAVRKGESFAHLPVYKESRYCASCHEGTVFGVHAYGTYSEWLESPAKKEGKQCQDCHMPPTGKMTNIAPGKGGIERQPATLASHHMPGANLDMHRQSLKLTVQIKRSPRGRHVDVEVLAERVGHRVPTGFPDRQLILVVTATDAKGARVNLLDGARLPKSVGKWSGFAGTLYAKQMTGEAGRTPIPFWLHVEKVVDSRLHPERPARSVFVFADAAQRVTVQLWYRRFWQEVADSRGWTDNDLLVHEKTLTWDDRK
ncbi:MAG: hypothetical protein EXR98_22115 [Gemmataceae bacterium]|nr:hypothetical protein [Gemmataceae bacterium]